jgi:glycosyltransferase involved in cell wall biosynthesis
MRILVLVPEAYGGFGGIAVYNQDFLDAMAGLEIVRSVTVLPRLVRQAVGTVPSKIDFRSTAANSLPSYVAEVVSQLGRSFDLVVSTHMYLLPFARLIAAPRQIPIACVLYGIEAWKPTGRLFVDSSVRRADVLISISDFTRQRFCGWTNVPQQRVSLLPNCIRQEAFGSGPKPRHLVERYGLQGQRVIMTLGRLDARERQKGMDELIDLMPRIVDAYSDVVCLIAGDGDDRPRLEAKVDALSLGNSVRFCGRVPEHEKADHYRLCDIFSMAGRQEGFGFVFLEALATGAPVVASNLDGSRDAVRDGALGELANPDDPDSLFGAITRALAKPRQVPPGLDYFAFENYVERLRGILRPYSGGFQELA